MRVKDVMTTVVVRISPDNSVRQAARLMFDNHVSGVPVVDDEGNLRGIISEGDLIGGSINIAAPIFEADGQAAGAVVVSAPRERLTAEHHERVGRMAARAARELSRGSPAPHRPTTTRAQALA